MKTKLICTAILVAMLGRLAEAQQPSAQPTDPVVKGAVVKVADFIKLPAKEAGVLVKLVPKEGAQVRAGEVIGNIDDREQQIKKSSL